jgi:hypothetical protein
MSIPTPERLRRQARRLDRQTRSAQTALNAMRNGSALNLYFVLGTPTWTLADGRRVHAVTAKVVIRHPRVIDVGDALPLSCSVQSQTYHYVEN